MTACCLIRPTALQRADFDRLAFDLAGRQFAQRLAREIARDGTTGWVAARPEDEDALTRW